MMLRITSRVTTSSCAPFVNYDCTAWLTWKVFIFALAFANLYALFGENALPIADDENGTPFHLLMIFVAAHVGGKLALCAKLPALFGMLVAGFIYGNALDVELNKSATSFLRSFAFMIILLRAGFTLDIDVIRKLSGICIRLSLLPCLVEALAVALCSYFFFSLPIVWSAMLGFVLAAVSPAVVVPEMINLQSIGLGVNKGIPTLAIASSSVDNVLAITLFSVFLSVAYSNTVDTSSSSVWSIAKIILQGPLEACLGIVYGIVMGILLWYIPERCNPYPRCFNADQTDLHRLVTLLLIASFAQFGSQRFQLTGSGPLAVLVLAFVAALRWRPFQWDLVQQDSLRTLWIIFEHYLFSLIAADVRIKHLQDMNLIIYGLSAILIGIIFRTITTYIVTFDTKGILNWKERLFLAIAWLPKATVQAAVGSLALDSAKTDIDKERGQLVLTLAVLSIIVTAPLGAIFIEFCGKLLLHDNYIDRQNRSQPQPEEVVVRTVTLPQEIAATVSQADKNKTDYNPLEDSSIEIDLSKQSYNTGQVKS